MPIHDWTRVAAGIFHHFHHDWITAISSALNEGVLPRDYYALAEQQAAGFGPDVLTLQARPGDADATSTGGSSNGTALLVAPPQVRFQARWTQEFRRRKKSTIIVRHVSGDDIVAVVEIVSPGNKNSHRPFQALIDKAVNLLESGIQLLILDLLPPSARDPRGFHSALWEAITEEIFTPPADKPLTLVSYESDTSITAYIEPVALGDALPDMPLFLEPGAHILVPLERTYREAFARLPARWRTVLEA